MKDSSGCNSPAEAVVQLESKWVPLKVQDSVVVVLVVVPELAAVLGGGGYLSHPFSSLSLQNPMQFSEGKRERAF